MKTLMLALLLSASVIGSAQVVRVDTSFGIKSQMQCSNVTIEEVRGMVEVEHGFTFAIGSFRYKDADFTIQTAKFDRSGMLVPDLPVYSELQRGSAVAIGKQGSGRIVVARHESSRAIFLGVLGFDQNGVVDTAFSADSVTGGFVQAMCIDPLDRIILGGRHWDTVNTTQYACTRLTKDGALDATFIRPIMKGRIVNCIAVDSLGRIYIGGSFDSIGGKSRSGLARLSPQGVLDETFSVLLDSGSIVDDIVVQDGLGIVILQRSSVAVGQTRDLIRYTFDGHPDTTFGPYDTTDRKVNDIAMLTNGTLMVSGRTSSWASCIERLNANGSVDSSFAIENPGQGQILGVCPETTGTLIAYGWGDIVDRVYHQRMFRLIENGRVDHSYNVHCGLDGMIESFQQLQDGSMFIGGSQVSNDTLQLGPSFTIDPRGGIVDGFRQDGYPMELLGRRSIVKSHILANKAMMVLDQTQVATDVGPAGLSTIYRLLPDGTRDAEYKVDSTLNNRIRTACFNEDGSAFIAGIFQTVDGVTRPGIAKLNTAGKVDLTFNPGSGVDTAVFAIAPAGGGMIVVGGAMSRYNGKPVKQVIRVLASGDLDTTFITTWTLDPPSFRAYSTVKHFAVDSKNNIVISGDFQSVNNIIYGNVARLRSNGQLDRTFAMDLISSIDVNELTVDHKDRPVIAGGTRVVRLNEDGTTDTTFRCVVKWSVRGISIVSTDTMYVYGGFDSVNSYPVQNIARLLIDDSPTSLAENSSVELGQPLQLNVFPNPANDKITIDVPVMMEHCSITVSDYTGRMVMRSTSASERTVEVDVREFPLGLYHVVLRSGENIAHSTFIKSE